MMTVDCLSRITFTSEKNSDEVGKIIGRQYEYYELDEKDGSYIVTINTSAPFPDNIEGH